MSAVEWLPFISPFIWMVLSLSILAWIPTHDRNKTLSINKKMHKCSVFLCWMLGIGWLFAIITPHIITPIIYVNTLEFSKLLLTPALIGLSVIVICRLFQKQCALSIIIETLCHLIRPLLPALSGLSVILVGIFADAWEAHANDDEFHEKRLKEANESPFNWKGDYVGKNYWDKY